MRGCRQSLDLYKPLLERLEREQLHMALALPLAATQQKGRPHNVSEAQGRDSDRRRCPDHPGDPGRQPLGRPAPQSRRPAPPQPTSATPTSSRKAAGTATTITNGPRPQYLGVLEVLDGCSQRSHPAVMFLTVSRHVRIPTTTGYTRAMLWL